MYQIIIRDANLQKVGEITDFTKIELIPRFNNVGTFAIDVPTDSFAAKELVKDKAGIIVRKDGQTIFSGTVTGRKRSFDSSRDTMTFAGKDDMFFLARTLAYPEISGNFGLQDYDIRSGNAEAVMKQYVDYNAGQNAELSRRWLTVETDKGLGSQVTGRARFDNLLELLQSLALSGGGLGFTVLQVDDSLQFNVYQPADKTRSAFFSPLLGNLASFEYSSDDPQANLIIAGGGGEGRERLIVWKANNNSIVKHGRTEIFVDQRNTTDLTELNQAIDEELLNKSEQNSLNFTPIDTPELSFGKHYNLGDKVSIVLTQPNEVVGIEMLYYFISAYQTMEEKSERVWQIQSKLDVIQDVVREVKITIDSSGETVSPVVGTEQSNRNSILGIFDKMKNLGKRIGNLERR